MKYKVQSFVVLLMIIVSWNSGSSRAEELRFYIGTYTHGKSQGIYTATLDSETGKVSQPQLAVEYRNPSFLAVHPDQNFIFAVGEVSDFESKNSGTVAAFRIDRETGKLKFLNHQASRGGAPCHLVVDQKGKHVLFANYVGGNVGALSIGKDGKLNSLTGLVQHEGASISPRQKGPHAHSINLDQKNRFAVAADLGLDQLITYRLTASGKLEPVAVHREKGGSGPRHFVFHPNGKFGYLLNEMNATVSALAYDSQTGKFESLQTLGTLPDDFEGRQSCAEVRIHQTGKFLYCSNRGHDSIAVYQVGGDGQLKRVQIVKTGGQEPRNFNLDPTGKFLLAENQRSDSIVVFHIDQDSGKLKPTGQVISVPTPVCIRFLKR